MSIKNSLYIYLFLAQGDVIVFARELENRHGVVVGAGRQIRSAERKENSNSHGARPVHLIITMIKWIQTSRLSLKNSLSAERGRNIFKKL